MKENYIKLSIRLAVPIILILTIYAGQSFEIPSYFAFFASEYYYYFSLVVIIFNSFFQPIKALITSNRDSLTYIYDDLVYFLFVFTVMVLLITENRIIDLCIMSLTLLLKFTYSSCIEQLYSSIPNSSKVKKGDVELHYLKAFRYFRNISLSLSFLLFIYGAYISTYPLSEYFVYGGLSLMLICSFKDSLFFISFMFDQVIEILSLDKTYIKNKDIIEKIAKSTTFVFNKGDVLTKEDYTIKSVTSSKLPAEELIHLAAYAEIHSDHPMAKPIKQHAPELDPSVISSHRFIDGHGVNTIINSKLLYVGNYKLMCQMGFRDIVLDTSSSLMHVSTADAYLGCIALANTVESTAKACIQQLKDLGIDDTIIFTGDRYITTNTLKEAIGVKEIHYDLLQRDKLNLLNEFKKKIALNETLSYIAGNTTEDLLLKKADVGILVNATSDSIGKYDVTIENSDLTILPMTISLSRRALVKARRIASISFILRLLSVLTVLILPVSPLPAIVAVALSNAISYFICKRK